VLGPVLYILYTADLALDTITATYADDTAILTVHKDYIEVSQRLQKSLFDTQIWLKKWRIRINKAKSGDFHHSQKDVSTSNLEWREDLSSPEREVFETTSQSQTKLEKTHIH